MTFHQALALAWDRLPQRRTYVAQQEVAAAQNLEGSALFPNAPSVSSMYVNDNMLGSAEDYITTQVQVTTPLWLPGEGTATQKLAQARGAAASAAGEAAHLSLALQLLNLSARAALDAAARDIAQRRLATSQALATDARNRFHTGEGAEADMLAADADVGWARVNVSDAEARLAGSLASLAALLGGETIPRLVSPVRPAALGPEGMAHDPRLAAAQRAVEVAQANLRLVRLQDRNDPEIGVVGINEKQYGAPWDTRFGVVLRFSFASEARNAPRRAAAEEQLTQAEARLEEARRRIVAQYRQANATLISAERGAAVAVRAARELAQRQDMVERSWKQGEMPLIEVVRANASAFDAAFSAARSRTLLEAARLEVVIAQGVIP